MQRGTPSSCPLRCRCCQVLRGRVFIAPAELPSSFCERPSPLMLLPPFTPFTLLAHLGWRALGAFWFILHPFHPWSWFRQRRQPAASVHCRHKGSKKTATATKVTVWTGVLLCLSQPHLAHAAEQPSGPEIKALILYDAPPAGIDGNKRGKAYAIMLRNLLGHWNSHVELLPVQQYSAGKLKSYDATFYLGSHYDHAIPPQFLKDVHHTDKTVVWFRYNIWQYAQSNSLDFKNRHGWTFNGLRGLNFPPSAEKPQPGFFSTVTYKGQTLEKFYRFNAENKQYTGDPDLGTVKISDPQKAQTLVKISNPQTNEQLPYVVRSKNLWYFADLPLSDIGPSDRYLVLCDLLHDILGTGETAKSTQRALIRLEDLSEVVVQDHVRQLADYMHQKRIPFGIATIPHFRDPLGVYRKDSKLGRALMPDIPFAQATRLRAALDLMLAKGGRIVAHGWTHQYGEKANNVSGLSGADWEFWDMVNNKPVPEDSVNWALERVDRSINELGTGPYKPFAFEVPHYQASPKAYAAIRQRFSTSWGRLVYYTSDTPNLDPNNPDRDFAVGQLFPYVIYQDHYGNKVLPENLGNIQYSYGLTQMGTPSQEGIVLAKDLLKHAASARVVRDGFASFFFHPFLLNPAAAGPAALQDFKTVVEGIESLGFQWADPAQL